MDQTKLYDNGGRTDDRYAAVYPVEGGRRYCRTMSFDCNRPDGVSLIDELPEGITDLSHLGEPIKIDDLPPGPREQVLTDQKEIYKGA